MLRMTNSINADSPILIVGAGPVGLCLALALVRRGITVQVFEALPELSSDIRASTFHAPTLEMFAEWGVVRQVLSQGYTVDRLQYWERRTRELIAQFDYQLIAGDTPYPYRLQCPQHLLTRVLKPIIEASPTGEVLMAHRFVGFEETGDGVVARFDTPAGIKSFSGSYLCGADGARSSVRSSLGLPFRGMTYEDRFLLIGTDFEFGHLFPQMGPVSYLFDPEEWTIILRLPDLVRVVFRLQQDEDEGTATQESALRARFGRFVGYETPIPIKLVQVYKTHQRVAETFRVGQTLLLGDAAHINNPAGGMGMNSGIHDAYNLANKLIQVLQGEPDTLLDQYSTERRTLALDNIRQYTDKTYRDMAAQDDTHRQQRNAHLRAISADPASARAYLLQASMLADRI